MNKKEWLDVLYYDIGKQQYNFELCGLTKLEDSTILSTYWINYKQLVFSLEPWEEEKLAIYNNRTILPNEIVLDIENKDELFEIIKKLKTFTTLFKLFSTGSRGYHIHLFFNREVTEEDKLFFIQYFNADVLKASSRSLIALEYTPHWKTKIEKKEIEWKKI